MKREKFNQHKFDEAAKRQLEQISEQTNELSDPEITLDLYYYMCWDCDEKYLQGGFFVPHFEYKVKCPRHPNHAHIEYMGHATARVKWSSSIVSCPFFVD